MRDSPQFAERDCGAAAVEFVFLFVFLFMPICYGTLSAGIVFSDKLSLTQGVREAARYGATLPYDAASRDTYLLTVRQAAEDSDYGQLGAGDPEYCVAFRETSGASPNWHLPPGGSAAINAPCPGANGPTRPHVLVVATKPGRFDFVLDNFTFTISSASVARYEGKS